MKTNQDSHSFALRSVITFVITVVVLSVYEYLYESIYTNDSFFISLSSKTFKLIPNLVTIILLSILWSIVVYLSYKDAVENKVHDKSALWRYPFVYIIRTFLVIWAILTVIFSTISIPGFQDSFIVSFDLIQLFFTVLSTGMIAAACTIPIIVFVMFYSFYHIQHSHLGKAFVWIVLILISLTGIGYLATPSINSYITQTAYEKQDPSLCLWIPNDVDKQECVAGLSNKSEVL